ncbi:MAG: radical SAM protein, partial [Opitutales bacterium]|nr:radical SAM protein [Opitutales bacterium]
MSTGPFPNAQTIQLPLLEPEAGNYFVAAYPPFSAWKAEQIPALKDTLAQPRSAPIGLYIHLPFCPKKCNYCYYLSYISQASNVVDRYIDAVTREAELYLKSEGIKGRSVNFAYFGGGTPSTLSSGQLTRLMNGLKRVLPWDRIEEVTYECAPRSVRDEFLSSMREAGVTRVSM